VIIDLSQQLKEPIGSIRRYSFSQSGDSTEKAEFPLEGELTLLRTDQGVFVTGVLNTRVDAVCSRCLGDFDQPLTLKIEEELLLTVDPSTGASIPTQGEGGAFTINENQEFDLGEAVRQYVLLALPMKPLCREDCAGLCPSCGHNLNLGHCSCSHPIDPRLAPLAKLVSVEERID
jgi:uncharacterized protein